MSTFNLWWTLGGTFVLVITLLAKAPVKVCQIETEVCLLTDAQILAEHSGIRIYGLRKVSL